MIQVTVADLNKLNTGDPVELFVIDASAPEVGASLVLYLCNQTQTGGEVYWQGQKYSAFPIQISGVEMAGQGTADRPNLSIGNVTGIFSMLCLQYKDLVGSRVTRKRVLPKYLDGGSNPNTSAGLPEDLWFIEKKTAHNSNAVTFQLSTALDLDGVKLPLIRVNATYCQVQRYRGATCGYTSTAYMSDALGTQLSATTDRGAYSSLNAYSVGDFIYVLYQNVRYYYVCVTACIAGTPLTASNFVADTCTRRIETGCTPRFDDGPGSSLPILVFPGTVKLPRT